MIKYKRLYSDIRECVLGACVMNLVEKVFGTHSDRELKLIYPIVNKIEKLRPQMQAMSDEELRDQTRKFRERLAKGETSG